MVTPDKNKVQCNIDLSVLKPVATQHTGLAEGIEGKFKMCVSCPLNHQKEAVFSSSDFGHNMCLGAVMFPFENPPTDPVWSRLLKARSQFTQWTSTRTQIVARSQIYFNYAAEQSPPIICTKPSAFRRTTVRQRPPTSVEAH